MWSDQQDSALKIARRWISDNNGQQVFRIFGYAGTGKTTLAKELAAGINGTVLFGAFTGKAALVLRSKGCADASTIHSLIYRAVEDPKTGVVTYVINPMSPVHTAKLVIIDECSMVGEELGQALLSFGKPVLVLGDPAQLPPVKDAGFFTDAIPDVMLTEVHRQAQDNPIIAMSMAVRNGERLSLGRYGESRVISGYDLTDADLLTTDQMLVGTNRTRRAYNAHFRQLKGFKTLVPEVGDKLVCLKNNHRQGLLNGSLWTAERVKIKAKVAKMEVRNCDAPHTACVPVNVPFEFFQGTEQNLDWRERKRYDEFDFGYVLTTHKAQGSQWPNVLVIDESDTFREDRARWLYTAITRAASTLTIAT